MDLSIGHRLGYAWFHRVRVKAGHLMPENTLTITDNRTNDSSIEFALSNQ